ncbi:MAG: hypothetical protein WD065_12085 [Planctomycetaceae bacterium]
MVRRVVVIGLLFLCMPGGIGPRCFAGDWTNDFESEQTSWTIFYSNTRSKALAHQRVADFSHSGAGSESFQFRAGGEPTNILLEHKLPEAAVIDELTASVWVNSTRNGAVLNFRMVFPHQIDPNTSKPAFVLIQGSRYESEDRWQKLECRADEKKIQREIVHMRSRFPAEDLRDAYVDGMILKIPMEPGIVNVAVDDATFGPIVPPRVTAAPAVSDEAANVIQKRVKLRLGHLQVDGRPFFPIMTPYHGEDPRELQSLGVNVVWVPDYQDDVLLKQFRELDLWATAVPPQPKSAGGNWLDSQYASLVPFSRETETIAFWMLGSKISPDMHKNLMNWAEQVRTADRHFDRPLMADVQGSERVSSRNISLLGTSRPVMQTTFPLRAYRDWLRESRNLAIPGSFVWTWMATEPYPALASSRNSAVGQPVYLEPEQLRLQLFAALAAGCQGIGYWSTTPLDDDDPFAVERRLAITQLNHELQLLGPMLATSTLVTQIPFSINDQPPPQRANAKVISFQGRKSYDPNAPEAEETPRQTDRRRADSAAKRSSRGPEDVIYEAALFRSPYGRLILPICYQDHAQFVPGGMTARDVRILVSDVEETASAWEITPTRIRYVPKKRVAGGVELKLSRFDMTTAIVLTSDPRIKEAFRSRIRDLNSSHAQTAVELARAKFKRTADVDAELTSLGAALPEAFNRLNQAGKHLRAAERALERQEFSSACDEAANVMQFLRILQREHWDAATRRWPSPASSPHTLCFQTLPDHWRMLKRIAKAAEIPTENRLPSGDFEDFDKMIVDGWRHEQMTEDSVVSTAQLGSLAHQGDFCLRLASAVRAGIEKPYILRQQRIEVHSPPFSVRPGDLLQVSGWIRIRTPVAANLDGVMVYDNLLGSQGGLRWGPKVDAIKPRTRNAETVTPSSEIQLTGSSNAAGPSAATAGTWQRFEILREVNVDCDYVLTFSLGGLGDVLFDDVQIHVHELGDVPLESGNPIEQEPGEPEDEKFSPFNIDLLKKLNVLPLPGVN